MRASIVAYKYFETSPRLILYATSLKDEGWDVEVFCLRRPGQARKETIRGVEVRRIQKRVRNEKGRFSYLLKIVSFAIRCSLQIAYCHLRRACDCVLVFSVPEFLVFSAVVPKISRTPIILDFCDIVPEFYATKFNNGKKSTAYRLLVLVERMSCQFADHVVASNHLWREKLVSRSVEADKCSTIVYCSDTSVFYPRPKNRSNDTFKVIYPGSLNWYQGVDVAIDAIGIVLETCKNVEFHIYGEGPEKARLREQAARLGLTDHVFVHDMVPASEVVNAIADSDLLVVPKRASSPFASEACSTKIVDCMNMNVPVVASDTRIERYYFTDDAIKFFESENAASLAESIRSVLTDATLRDRLVSNGRKYVEANGASVAKATLHRIVDGLLRR
jgi:glycosyltransferase involved in cell wall biosynthesis